MRNIFDADVDHHTLIGSDDNLSAFLKFERMLEEQEEKRERQHKAEEEARARLPKLTQEQLTSIQMVSFGSNQFEHVSGQKLMGYTVC